MEYINGLPGIGSNGVIGEKGDNGMDVVYEDSSNYEELSNITYPYLKLDNNFNMFYQDEGTSKKTIYLSTFINSDNFNVNNDSSIIYTKYNLLCQKNIYSKKHREKIIPDIDYNLYLVDGEVDDESENSSFNFFKISRESLGTLNICYKNNGFNFSGDKITFDSSKGVYMLSKEQATLKNIYNNLINLIVATPTSFFHDGKKYNYITFNFKNLNEYILNDYSDEFLKRNLKIVLFRNDKLNIKGEESVLKNYDSSLLSTCDYGYVDNYNEYNFSYYLKIYLKNEKDVVFLLYSYVMDEIKNKIEDNKEDTSGNSGNSDNENTSGTIFDKGWTVVWIGDKSYKIPNNRDVQLVVDGTTIVEGENEIPDPPSTDEDYQVSDNTNLGSGSGGFTNDIPTLNNGMAYGNDYYNNRYYGNNGFYYGNNGNNGNNGMTAGYKPGWNTSPLLDLINRNNSLGQNLLITSTNNRYK